MIFDRIVRTSDHHFGHSSPRIAKLFVTIDDKRFLFQRPMGFGDGRIEVIVPTFATLFADASF